MTGEIFKAYDVRAKYPDPLNKQEAWKVGYGAAQFFLKENGGHAGQIVVSRDMRPSSPELAQALMRGIRAAGLDVVDVGMRDTAFLYYAVPTLSALGGIQTTASHNPIQYNGFKICGKGAKPIGSETGLKEIQNYAVKLQDKDLKRHAVGGYMAMDLTNGYRAHVLKPLEPLGKELTVYIDASNGMAGQFIPTIFHNLPDLNIIPLNFETNGTFDHDPNPLVKENMIPTQQGVIKHKADFGVCFDGDGDRCMLCDENGQIVGCDHLTALLADYFVAQESKEGREPDSTTIVYDLRSSKVVAETLAALGANGKRSRVGHVFMKANLRETGAVFGGELSGHFYFRDNYFADSGAIALSAVLSIVGQSDQTLSQLLEPLRQYAQSGEMNYEVADKQAVQNQLKEKYKNEADIDELDGVTVDCFENKGWWFNVRPSNTEPLLRFNAEARDQATLDALLAELAPVLGSAA